MTKLRGMTWDHPRAYDPLVAVSALYGQRHPGVEISWERRSLQDFEHYPVEDLAARYDLIIIDHPHVGEAAAKGALLPFDRSEQRDRVAAIAAGSVGRSFASYHFDGQQWALPVDAAAQVQAFRRDRLAAPARRWSEAVAMAGEGLVAIPLRAPHALMSLMTLAANAGTPPAIAPGPFLPRGDLLAALDLLAKLFALVDPVCLTLDPIAASELLVSHPRWAMVPLVYGYVPYARPGFRAVPLAFADIPAIGAGGPRGSVLGGTGMAVSAHGAAPDVAQDFALFATAADIQATVYAETGQPAHRSAWESDAVNRACGDFYRATLATLDAAYLRPRHAGYIGFQARASTLIEGFLRRETSAAAAAASLDQAFAASFTGQNC
jgi:multiple sugar transport system substrate-binding protein